jgi:glycosyltransferase involved in cell wall biosynthesis
MNKPTVTVGIPAYNEIKGLPYLLESLRTQEWDNFILEKVLVISDGSDDGTDEYASAFAKNHPQLPVILVNDKKRLGQAARLKQIYQTNQSDILITLDADTKLANNLTLAAAVECFTDPHIGLVGFNDTPVRVSNFFGRIVTAHINLWYHIRKNINGGDSVYNHHGCASAVRKDLAQVAGQDMPTDIVAADTYLYFKAKELGLKLAHARKAVVYYKAPTNYQDYTLQTLRFNQTRSRITEHFGDWIKPYRVVPKSAKLKGVLIMCLKNPVFTALALGMQIWIKNLNKLSAVRQDQTLWTTIRSTKE